MSNDPVIASTIVDSPTKANIIAFFQQNGVIDEVAKFTESNEMSVAGMYSDPVGLPTVGIGLQFKKEFFDEGLFDLTIGEGLNFHVMDSEGKFVRLASSADIMEEYKINHQQGQKDLWKNGYIRGDRQVEYRRQVEARTGISWNPCLESGQYIIMPNDTIHLIHTTYVENMFSDVIQGGIDIYGKEWAEKFLNLPKPVQVAMGDIAYNVGTNGFLTGFPKLNQAILDGSLERILANSERRESQIGKRRQERTLDLIRLAMEYDQIGDTNIIEKNFAQAVYNDAFSVADYSTANGLRITVEDGGYFSRSNTMIWHEDPAVIKELWSHFRAHDYACEIEGNHLRFDDGGVMYQKWFALKADQAAETLIGDLYDQNRITVESEGFGYGSDTTIRIPLQQNNSATPFIAQAAAIKLYCEHHDIPFNEIRILDHEILVELDDSGHSYQDFTQFGAEPASNDAQSPSNAAHLHSSHTQVPALALDKSNDR